MTAPSRFNLRVYGICVRNGAVLVNEEMIRGRRVIKFPGGGLELGEGTRDGLAREWQEELGLPIAVEEHFYTTDFYQPSAFDDSQVVSVYYRVRVPEDCVLCNTEENERTYWLPLQDLRDDTFTLPIDRIVGKMLMAGL